MEKIFEEKYERTLLYFAKDNVETHVKLVKLSFSLVKLV